MDLMDVTKFADINPLTHFQHSIADDFRGQLIAFYGDDYKKVLAKGKILRDGKVIRVVNEILKIEKDFGV